MSDLVERLRKQSDPEHRLFDTAADEIERLTDSVNYYKTRSERSLDYTAELEDKIERLRESLEIEASAYDLLAENYKSLERKTGG